MPHSTVALRYVLAYLALDAHIEDQLNEAQPTRIPPEPFVTIGATDYLNWK